MNKMPPHKTRLNKRHPRRGPKQPAMFLYQIARIGGVLWRDFIKPLRGALVLFGGLMILGVSVWSIIEERDKEIRGWEAFFASALYQKKFAVVTMPQNELHKNEQQMRVNSQSEVKKVATDSSFKILESQGGGQVLGRTLLEEGFLLWFLRQPQEYTRYVQEITLVRAPDYGLIIKVKSHSQENALHEKEVFKQDFAERVR